MNKSALNKDIRREIKKSASRFLSIMLIIALGVGFFVSIKATAPSMRKTADDYFGKTNLMDIELMSTVGFDSTDVEEISKIDGIEAVQPSYSSDVVININNKSVVAKVMSLPDVKDVSSVINAAVIIEGRMPQAEDECVVAARDMFGKSAFEIGESVTFGDYSGDTEVSSFLKRKQFKVVGLVDSPLFFTYSFGRSSIGDGMLSSYIIIPESNFTYERYTEVYLTVEYDGSSFSDAYNNAVDRLISPLSELGEVRFAEFSSSLENQITDAEKEFNDQTTEAYEELNSAKQKLEDAKQQLDAAVEELNSGWEQYLSNKEQTAASFAEARDMLASALETVKKNEASLKDGEEEYEASKKKADKAFTEAREKLDNGWKEYEDSLTLLNESYDKLVAGRTEYETGVKKYEDAVKEYEDGKAQYEESVTEIDSYVAEYEKGKAEYEKGLAEYEENLALFNEQKAEFDKQYKVYTDGLEKYEKGLAEYQDGEDQYNDALLTYKSGREEYEQGEIDYAAAVEKYESGKIEYENGKAEYDAGKAKYDEGKAKYDEEYASFAENKNTVTQKRKEYDEGLAAYNEGLAKYEEGKAEYDKGLEQYKKLSKLIGDMDSLVSSYDKIGMINLVLLIRIQSDYEDVKADPELNAMLNEALGGEAPNINAGDVLDDPDGFIENIRGYVVQGKIALAEMDTKLKQADEELTAGKQTLDENKVKLDEAGPLLVEAEAQIAAGEKELEAARVMLEDSEAELNAAKEKLDTYETEITEAPAKLEAARKKLDDSKARLDSAEIQLAETSEKLYDAKVELYEAKRELDGYKDPIEDAKAQIEEGQAKLDEAKTKLDDAETELSDGDKKIKDAQKQIEEAPEKLKEAEEQLADVKAELDEAKTTLDNGETEYAEGKAKLEDALAELEDGEEKYKTEKSDTDATLIEAEEKIVNGKIDIQNAYSNIETKTGELEQAEREANIQLDDAKEELDKAEEQIDEAKQDYEDGLTEYQKALAEAEEKIADGSSRIKNARSQFEELVSGKWYVFNRDDMVVNYTNFKDDTGRIDAIAGIFPVFFLLVAALVCLTTMSRMVDEQRTIMGTYKALGYGAGDIMKKYIVYALTAALVGSVIGQVICVLVLPRSIAGAYSIMYFLPKLQIVMPWDMSIISVLIALACTVLVAVICCRKELTITTAALMRPKAPKAGKQILLEKIKPLWKAMSFSSKITARNLFRYKARLVMTVIGISGCMALIVAGFALYGSISSIITKQYTSVNHYNAMITLSTEYNDEEAAEFDKKLVDDGRLTANLFAKQLTGKAKAPGGSASEAVYIFVARSPELLPEVITLHSIEDGKELPLTDDSVIITQKMAKNLGIEPGDDIVFTSADVDYTLKVTGIVENYVYSYIYLTPSTYQKVFDVKEVTYNSVISKSAGPEMDSDAFISDWLSENPDILSITFLETIKSEFSDTIGNMKFVVIIMIVAAGALAFIVVYNLTNINISERIREIATIKVFGFNHREVNMYVFRENIVMCLMGIIFGSALGYFLAQFIIKTVEVDVVMFPRDVNIICYLFAAVLTAIFTLLVNIMMSKKMKNVSMVESLKAIE